MELVFKVPDEVARALPLPQDEKLPRLQTELACLLYGKGWLSYGQAATLSGLSHDRFGLELGSRAIPRNYSADDLDHDLAYARGEQHIADL